MWKMAIVVVALGIDGCADHRPPLTEAAFVAARDICGAKDAGMMHVERGVGIGFDGYSPDHPAQARCLAANLGNTRSHLAI